MNFETPYRIFPLGDSAITVDLGNVIDENINRQILTMFYHLQNNPLPGMIEAAPAYSTLTVFYDIVYLRKIIAPGKTVYEWMEEQLQKSFQHTQIKNDPKPVLKTIPVCYAKEFALDIDDIASLKNISVDEVIKFHTSKTYRVYMLGFLPGFAYMGEVNEQIMVPRKLQPRQKVEAGSVGIAGKQTGIYPLDAPGGWQIIGRTPLKLFDPGIENPTLYKTGDMVQFYPISKDEFENF